MRRPTQNKLLLPSKNSTPSVYVYSINTCRSMERVGGGAKEEEEEERKMKREREGGREGGREEDDGKRGGKAKKGGDPGGIRPRLQASSVTCRNGAASGSRGSRDRGCSLATPSDTCYLTRQLHRANSASRPTWQNFNRLAVISTRSTDGMTRVTVKFVLGWRRQHQLVLLLRDNDRHVFFQSKLRKNGLLPCVLDKDSAASTGTATWFGGPAMGGINYQLLLHYLLTVGRWTKLYGRTAIAMQLESFQQWV
ncbi:hypothetical protein BHM03_00001637 [Ensete ventricosum]|nr:hypothetical protein BHM03_00001637 [Ensete ventricosum]